VEALARSRFWTVDLQPFPNRLWKSRRQFRHDLQSRLGGAHIGRGTRETLPIDGNQACLCIRRDALSCQVRIRLFSSDVVTQ
jgi:hypothetical protein